MGAVPLEDALCEVDYVPHSAAVVMASIHISHGNRTINFLCSK